MKARGSSIGDPLSPLGTARQRLAPVAALPTAVSALLEDGDLGPEAGFLVFQLLAWLPEAGADRDAVAALVARTLIAAGQGSTRIEIGPALRPLLERASAIVGGRDEAKPLVLEDGHLYHHRLFHAEGRVAAALAERAQARAPYDGSACAAAVADVVSTAVPTPGAEQVSAIEAALTRRLAVITGGPGTGKTTIALAVMRALVRVGVPPEAVALAAPTGKAAHRLGQATQAGLAALTSRGAADSALLAARPAAQTLHRLLGYSASARAFAHRPESPLPHRVVIVDESSMIDLVLMDRLLAALAPDATLVLLGDADQLPSVEAGAVFRDLAAVAVRLTRSHRLDPAQIHGRRILELAAAVRAGDGEGPPALAAEAVTFAGPERVGAAGREALLERWYGERVAAVPAEGALREPLLLDDGGFSASDEARLDALLAHQQRFRLLAVTRGRPTGTDALNAWMHRRFGGSGADPIPGEPVMMLRNDYDRGLWNGDQGIVVDVREAGRRPRAAAAFRIDGRWSAFFLESLRDTLSLAFALTVHKAQGSEHDDVLLVLPETAIPLFTRELLYTALTRSRRSVVICGESDVLAAGAVNALVRSSGIAARLAALSG